jgi:hypothetical protein
MKEFDGDRQQVIDRVERIEYCEWILKYSLDFPPESHPVTAPEFTNILTLVKNLA